jgi:hypothetical protein
VVGGLVVAALFLVMQIVGYHSGGPLYNDSYRYLQRTVEFSGGSSHEATVKAQIFACQAQVRQGTSDEHLGQARVYYKPSKQAMAACEHQKFIWLKPEPRYDAIFHSRPGYPFLASLIAPAVGPERALWAVSVLATIAGGGIVALLLRMFGCRPLVALSGQVLYYLAPTGYWGVQLLTNGLSLALALVALLGAVLLLRRRPVAGGLVFAGAFAGGLAVRYSDFTLLGATMTVAALAGLCRKELRHRGTALLAGLSVAGYGVLTLVAAALSWPGGSESLQETFTQHFKLPDVPDPTHRLVLMNKQLFSLLPWSFDGQGMWALVLAVVGFVALWRFSPTLALPTTAVASLGLLGVMAHPVTSDFDRLNAPLWVLAVVAVPVLFQAVRFERAVPDDATAAAAPASPPNRFLTEAGTGTVDPSE